MKKLFYSVLVFGLFSTSVRADHILGGDITYTHLDGLKYRVNVTMFRDCDECLLAGKGGGDNTKDCGGFDLYLYTVQSSICSRSLIERVPIAFNSYKSIINLCSDASSKCSESPNFAHGIEAHYYSGIVDFSKYQDYKECNFELSIQTPMRKDDLTNISGTEQYFFTYSELNPWITHHSPEFRSNPTMLLNCGKDFSENVLAQSSPDDSIQVSLVTPLKSRTSTLTYAGDYTKDKPLRVWCGADAGCAPDITTSPVTGFYLNSQNGLVAFNPVNCNEKAVVVYEVRKWTKDEFGNYTLVSKVRRDIQYTVVSVSGNNPPSFAAGVPDKITACIGQKESREINATDAITMTPSGPLPADTVRFEVINPPSGLTYEMTAIPDAPYYKLDIYWEPLAKDAGKTFNLIVRITDNACPMLASREKAITLYANPSPKTEFVVNKLDCGHLVFNETTGEGKWWSWNLKSLTSDWTGSQRKDTLRIRKEGSYTFIGTATGENGCISVLDTVLDFATNDILIDLIDPEALDYAVCLNDSLHLKAEITSTDEFTASWVTSDGLRQYNGHSVSLPFHLIGQTDEWQLWIETTRNGLKCSDIKPVTIDVLPLPDVSAWDLKEVCYGSSDVPLMDGVSPDNGQWEIRHKSEQNWSLVKDNVFVTTTWEHKHFDTEYLLKYTVTDDMTGCSAMVPAAIHLKRVPQMELKDLEVCATGSRLSLKVLVDRPFVYETGRFTWTGLDELTTFEYDQNGDWLIIPDNVLGQQRIVAVNRTGFGCESTDTGIINVLKDIKIELTAPGMICQDDSEIDLSLLTELNTSSGNWFSPDKQDWIVNGKLSPEACGQFRIGYVVDQFGCYDYQEFTIDVRCMPDFQIDLPDTVCKNMNVIQLNAAPAGGIWYGEGVRNTELDLSLVTGQVNLVYVYLDGICSYETEHAIVVEESPVIEVGEYPQSICEGELIVIEGVHFDHAQWDINVGNGIYNYDPFNYRIEYQPSVDEVLTGVVNFVFMATGKGICKAEQVTISTKINPTPVISFTANANHGCAPFELNLKSKSDNVNVDLSDVQFEWNFGDPNSIDNLSHEANPVHLYNVPGKYNLQLVAIHKLGCEFRSSLNDAITVWPAPEAEFMLNPDGVVSTFSPRVSFINLSKGENLSFIWDFGDGITRNSENPIHEFPSDTGTYTVILRTENGFGCSDEYVDYVYVGPDIRIFIPNAFTPDSKGPVLTETFSVQGQNIKDVKVTIYNRWGEIMTVFSGLDGNWDGTYNGVMCMSGVYFYNIEALSVTGHTYEYQGTLTLIR